MDTEQYLRLGMNEEIQQLKRFEGRRQLHASPAAAKLCSNIELSSASPAAAKSRDHYDSQIELSFACGAKRRDHFISKIMAATCV